VNKKKHILLFIDWYFPAYKAGGPVQSCLNLVNRLSDTYHFSVITGDTEYTESQRMPGIEVNVWTKNAKGHRVMYVSADRRNAAFFKKVIDAETFDYAYLNGMYSAAFTRLPLSLIPHEKVVVAARGMLAPSALKVKPLKKMAFLLYAKLSHLFSGVIFHATHEGEANDIHTWFPGAQVRVAGNLPAAEEHTGTHPLPSPPPLRVVNIARIAPEKNLLFALEVLQHIRFPLQFDFYGPVYAREYLEKCNAEIKKLPSCVQARACGPIPPSETSAILASAHLMFMPTRGENFGHVIMESWQQGTPVLISDQTPWQQLEQKKLGAALSLNSQESFVAFLEKLFHMQEKEYSDMRDACRTFANEYLHSSGVLQKNISLFS
jgi:glycosyltransferase involved in cell wall biosynthesis